MVTKIVITWFLELCPFVFKSRRQSISRSSVWFSWYSRIVWFGYSWNDKWNIKGRSNVHVLTEQISIVKLWQYFLCLKVFIDEIYDTAQWEKNRWFTNYLYGPRWIFISVHSQLWIFNWSKQIIQVME